MSTAIDRAPEVLRRPEESNRRSRTFPMKILLACGIAYGVLYVIANDVIAATMYGGYNHLNQAISELSSTQAPSRAFLTAMLPIFVVLVLGFGIGVWRFAAGNRALRVTGAILVAQGLFFPLWLLAPMTTRTEMVERGTGANDLGHLVLTAAAILFIVTEMAVSAAALGKRFRIFSLAMLATVLLFGVLTAVLSPGVEAGGSTPWMGFVERVSYGAWLVWMGVLAVALMRRLTPARSGPPFGPPSTPARA